LGQHQEAQNVIDAAAILLKKAPRKVTQLRIVSAAGWPRVKSGLTREVRAWAARQGFEALPLTVLQCFDAAGELDQVLIGAPREGEDAFALGALASRLPTGTYAFAEPPQRAAEVALGWCLELYKYDPFRVSKAKDVKLVCPRGVDLATVVAIANASFTVRDQVNAPSNLFGPDELENAARKLARTHGARLSVTRGRSLEKLFPLVHVVGAASVRKPRLIDLTWGNPRHPKVTLVGKGVCFDTGGLDIKPSSGMLLMKKDMGGAANVLGLGQLIMGAKLKLRLRILVPTVENAISGNAFRPGDVFKSRKGLTVEIGNTDAEGRLILCDALALADEEAPELLIDMATLTGAARVALGPDLPPFYTNDDDLAQAISSHGAQCNDPLWRMPLWHGYETMIDTPIADVNNAGQGGFAGSITAALFLRRFVEKAKAHVHFDIFAWVPNAKPGRPKGGEQQGMRALFSYLSERFGR
jgi:leucyl aminopeptidase